MVTDILHFILHILNFVFSPVFQAQIFLFEGEI